MAYLLVGLLKCQASCKASHDIKYYQCRSHFVLPRKYMPQSFYCTGLDMVSAYIFRSFVTDECFQDLRSTLTAFDYLAKKRLSDHPGSRVIPSIMSSDVVENFFSSERARCNGANTNPTILAYSKAINTIFKLPT